jgi:hypothetical protein
MRPAGRTEKEAQRAKCGKRGAQAISKTVRAKAIVTSLRTSVRLERSSSSAWITRKNAAPKAPETLENKKLELREIQAAIRHKPQDVLTLFTN